MRSAARLTGELLARKGHATPTGGFASAAIALSQSLPAPDERGLGRLASGGTGVLTAGRIHDDAEGQHKRSPGKRRERDAG